MAPPKWLSKAEKFQFHRLVSQREAAGKPVSATESDGIADLVNARSRLSDLRRLYARALRALRANPEWNDDRTYVLRLANQIDQATARCHRMARQLGFGPGD